MPPLTIMVKPVSAMCNMSCRYCFYHDVASHRQQYSYGRMTADTLEQLVRRALIYADGQASFCFQGGEPMLAGLPFFRDLIRFQKMYRGRGVKISNAIQTNGLLINEEWASFFAENQFLVGVSLDGNQAIHDSFRIHADGSGTYDRVLEGIGRLKANRAEYNVLCVVTEQATMHGAEIFETLKEHRYLQFIPCIEDFDGGGREYSPDAKSYGRFLKDVFDCYERSWRHGKYVSVRIFDNYINILRGLRPEHCGMSGQCGTYYLVEANGNVYPCDFYVLDQWKLGNIVSQSLVRIAKEESKLGFVDSSKPVCEKCIACRWFALCRGGCRRDREPFVDAKPGLNRYCEGYTGFFEYAYPRMAKLAKEVF